MKREQSADYRDGADSAVPATTTEAEAADRESADTEFLSTLLIGTNQDDGAMSSHRMNDHAPGGIAWHAGVPGERAQQMSQQQ